MAEKKGFFGKLGAALVWPLGLRIMHQNDLDVLDKALVKYRNDAQMWRRTSENLETQLAAIKRTWQPKTKRDPKTGRFVSLSGSGAGNAELKV